MATKKQKNNDNTCRFPDAMNDGRPPATMADIPWRVFRIMAEFVEGFQFLSETSREVTIFGSARLDKNNRWYKETEKLGRLLAKNKFAVITGGGPGIMEAANKGAFEAGGQSIGLNIQLPTKQRMNDYVKEGRAFYYFFTRKVMMAASAQAYVFCPGGFGTLDEFFEMVMLIQTGKAQKVPMICLGHEFWDPLVNWIKKDVCEKFDAIDVNDTKLFTVVDTAEEAYALIKNSKERTIF
ncbi:MAG: TIGR00730 family Rossman fold protein [Patescibacteria group bacterium]|jgi:hypothetical protein